MDIGTQGQTYILDRPITLGFLSVQVERQKHQDDLGNVSKIIGCIIQQSRRALLEEKNKPTYPTFYQKA